MRPRIGITASRNDAAQNRFDVSDKYVEAIWKAGGLPVMLPCHGDIDALLWETAIDALLLPGGCDIDPAHYGEEPTRACGRMDPEADVVELALCRAFLARRRPIFGICRGSQLLNVSAGGDLYQDIPSQVGTRLLHEQKAPADRGTHQVTVAEHSLLASIVQRPTLRVNSYHHQAARKVAAGFAASASAHDGVVEAIERPGDRFTLGVQWHPELMAARCEANRALFEAFVEAART